MSSVIAVCVSLIGLVCVSFIAVIFIQMILSFPAMLSSNSQAYIQQQRKDSIGTFSLAFTGEAPGVGNTTCNLKTCRARNSRWLKVTYTFPSWLFRAAIAATFSDSGIGSPEFLLRVHRVIPAGGFMYFNSIIGHVARGEIENVKGLLRRKEAAVTDQLSDWDGGTTALHLALGNYDIPMVKLLIHEGADMFMERQGRPGQAPFVVAIQNVYASPDTPAPEREALEGLLPMDALLEMAEFSPLHKVVLGIRHLDLPEFLRLNTCPLESVDTTGLTPLHYAAIRGDARAARALLDAGAELEFASRERRETALLLACRHASSLEVVEMLVAAGADVNTSNAVGRTPLIMVTFKKGLRRTNRMADPVRIMAVLVRAGAAVHAQDKYHGTALDYACLSNEPELLDFLISSGADYNHQDYEGSTSLMNAVLYHACKSAELLLRRGADVHITDNDGKNILHYVASVSNADMMGVFARSGISDMETKAIDKDRKTPLQVFDERPGVSETPKLREAFLHLLDTVGKPSQHQFKHEGASSDEWTDTESEYAEFFDALETIVSP
ncbi:hypothetical protein VSDG_04795 [Cytospora chrysosperma]|uniref:Uncharacterized protein n=1 Tax=Cytospora chrysosperma TaxID=252740 RepID=A0A423W1K4_CYTCH|nr:hypothetical protein VSDG_04795 [Valsa sordida]